jgi:tRNA uridine 5-carboxymethylaminomethyl modification enzyme
MKRVCEGRANLALKQAEAAEILTEGGHVRGVLTRFGAIYSAKAVVIAAGTYLNGTVHVGEVSCGSGPDAVSPSLLLPDSLKKLGVELRRFKTGTPARVHVRSIDFSVLERQYGDAAIQPFSFATDRRGLKNQVVCHIAYTNEETHRIIRENIRRSPIYSGRIDGVGPRYCPSIEDKVMRFADKSRHQLFIEPMGLDTDEYYLQGMSSSLPEDVQSAFLRTIKGLENVEIMRCAYAIEYDCVNPQSLRHTLEFKAIRGLFGAGQFNGTSGYEEAAAQGLVAGINAARLARGREMLSLPRSSSYIGTLIDDLVLKGVTDPYRMMTSRSEYRLLLRQDNADERLTPLGYEIGLISKERYDAFLEKQSLIEYELKRVNNVRLALSDGLNAMLSGKGTVPVSNAVRASDLIRRPQVSYDDLEPFDPGREELPYEVKEQVNLRIEYEGYIAKQLAEVERLSRLEEKLLPQPFDYTEVKGLSLEAVDKLNRVQPENIGQAGRISGVSPADVGVLAVWRVKY